MTSAASTSNILHIIISSVTEPIKVVTAVVLTAPGVSTANLTKAMECHLSLLTILIQLLRPMLVDMASNLMLFQVEIAHPP